MGYSGHGYVVAEALQLCAYSAIFYAERNKNELNPFGLTYTGFERNNDFPWDSFDHFALGVGDNYIRDRIADDLVQKSKSILTIIHPEAKVSAHTKIGIGVFIARNSVINPMAQVDHYAIVNTGAIVEHECFVGQSAHIAPGAVLAGKVTIGAFSFVGANAVIKQNISIGKNSFIGAGSVVLRDVPDGITVAGNPAKVLRK